MALIKLPLPQDTGNNDFLGLFDATGLQFTMWRGRNVGSVTVGGQSTAIADLGIVLVAGSGSGVGTELNGFRDTDDVVAPLTSFASLRTAGMLYAFDGTNWRRLQTDASENLKVTIPTALPTGSNLIGGIKLYDSTAVGLLADAAQRLGVRPAQGNISTATQLTVTTTPTLILSANTARVDFLLTVVSGSVVYVGGTNGVAPSGTAGGTALSAGNSFGGQTVKGAIYGVCASATALVSVLEVS